MQDSCFNLLNRLASFYNIAFSFRENIDSSVLESCCSRVPEGRPDGKVSRGGKVASCCAISKRTPKSYTTECSRSSFQTFTGVYIAFLDFIVG